MSCINMAALMFISHLQVLISPIIHPADTEPQIVVACMISTYFMAV